MGVIYETTGKAAEYFELAFNPYLSCSHKCEYCYAPEALHKTRESFFNDQAPRKDVIPKLAHDVLALGKSKEKRPILLSFVGDVYQPLNDNLQLTARAIGIMKERGLSVAILTKGGLRAAEDFKLLDPKTDKFGVSLVMRDDKLRQQWEPGAASTGERLASLLHAKRLGLTTFVSLEPIINFEQAAQVIESSTNSLTSLRSANSITIPSPRR